jgi:hypothetical protein
MYVYMPDKHWTLNNAVLFTVLKSSVKRLLLAKPLASACKSYIAGCEPSTAGTWHCPRFGYQLPCTHSVL